MWLSDWIVLKVSLETLNREREYLQEERFSWLELELENWLIVDILGVLFTKELLVLSNCKLWLQIQSDGLEHISTINIRSGALWSRPRKDNCQFECLRRFEKYNIWWKHYLWSSKIRDELSAFYTVSRDIPHGAPSLPAVIKVINNLTRQDDSRDQQITGPRSWLKTPRHHTPHCAITPHLRWLVSLGGVCQCMPEYSIFL